MGRLRILVCAVLLGVLPACGAPSRQVSPPAAAARGDMSGAVGAGSHGGMAGAGGAGSDGGMAGMEVRPVRAVPTADELAYVAGMVAHHRQALRMAEVLRGRGGVPYRMRNLADHIAAIQGAEVADMTEFLEAWGRALGTRPAAMHAHMAGMAPEAQLRLLERADGAEAGRLFLRLMIAHHQGAVEISTAMLPMAENPWVISLARHVIADQRVEIAAMRRALDGGSGSGA